MTSVLRPDSLPAQVAELMRDVDRLKRAILDAQVWISTTAPTDTDAYPLWYDTDDTC